MGGLSKRNIKIFSAVIIVFLFLSSVPLTSASQEIIDSDYKKGKKLKVSAVLYKDTGEIDDEWDYYAIKVTLEDIKYKNDPWVGPLKATVRVAVPKWAEEVPTNHQPDGGWEWGGTITFQYQGISFSMKLPSEYVSYDESTDSFYRYFDWTVDGTWDGIAYWWFIFEDYAEFAVGIRVPQGKKPNVLVYGWAAWYRFVWLPFVGFCFIYVTQEEIYWVSVDPPGATLPPSPPMPGHKLPTPIIIIGRHHRK